jgi:hypothetical protein
MAVMRRPWLTRVNEVAGIVACAVLIYSYLESTKRLPQQWPAWLTVSPDTATFIFAMALLAVIGLGLWRLRRLEAAKVVAKLEEQMADGERGKSPQRMEQRLTELVNQTGAAINTRISDVQRDIERRVAAVENSTGSSIGGTADVVVRPLGRGEASL